MVEFENPVARTVFVRLMGPLVPVWLFGVALVLALDRYSVGGTGLTTPGLGLFLGIYSLMVAGLVSALYYREWRRSPSRIGLSVSGLTGESAVPRSPPVAFGYAEILRVHAPGYFPARVEAQGVAQPVEWLNLTPENAARVQEAWEAWRERQQTGA